jgi:hypothetical protein
LAKRFFRKVRLPVRQDQLGPQAFHFSERAILPVNQPLELRQFGRYALDVVERGRFQSLQNELDRELELYEQLIGELRDVFTILGQLSDYIGMMSRC